MQAYLKATDIIDYHDSTVQDQAKNLSFGCNNDEEIAKACFEFVRDAIKHSVTCPQEVEPLSKLEYNV